MGIKFWLDWAVLSISFYNTISLLWLGWMVLLNGNRRSAGTWLTGAGLLVGALFFTSHTAILGRGLSTTGFGMNFWWSVSWTPAVIAPLAWYGAMLWYAGFQARRPHPHRFWLALVVILAGVILLLLVFANPMPNYHYVAGHVLLATPSFAGVPALVWAYLAYTLLCYLLPLDLLRRRAIPAPDGLRAGARQRARPWLMAASLALLLAGLLLSWTALWALDIPPLPGLSDPDVARAVMEFDLSVEVLVAFAITLLGRAIVAYEVFTGHPLPRNRFFHQWRSTVILAAGFGSVVAGSLIIHLEALYSLMLATLLMTLFYALYTWRSYAEREQFMERLRPFVASQNLYGRLTESTPSPDTNVQDFFNTLCGGILNAGSALLVPAGSLATLAGPPLAYPPGAPRITPPPFSVLTARFSPATRCQPAGEASGAAWMVPLWSGHGLDGVLFLGEKMDGGLFTEEEIELAQAGGERLLDLLAGSEMARLSLDLLRQRLSQARVLEGQSRRVLHDEILPELHTAILYLSGQQATPEIHQAVETLSAAHRRVSNLLRASGSPAPQRLAQEGLVAALQALLANDFAGEFEQVEWRIEPGAAEQAQTLPLFAAEVVYFAARELVRNAARYARGGCREGIRLVIRLDSTDDQLRLRFEDNGVGLAADCVPNDGGSGSGLRIHSAMLAAVSGSLEVSTMAESGTMPGSGTMAKSGTTGEIRIRTSTGGIGG